MHALICPTITATEAHAYREQMERVEALGAKRLHLDFMDGHLAPVRSVSLEQAWWPGGKLIDLHIMYQRPVRYLREILEMKPHLVIVHAEAEGNFMDFAAVLHKYGIKVGLALLPKTPVSTVEPALSAVDHLLIFSGHLGHFGGEADMALLAKAQAAKAINPKLEIGWDGGVNDNNVHLLAAGGVNVLNVGGFIHRSSEPAAAYAKLKKLVE